MPSNSTRSTSFVLICLALVTFSPLTRAAVGSASVPNGMQSTAGQATTPRQSGTVKAITPHDFVLTNAAGGDVAVTVPEKARVLLVPPGSHDLSAAQPGTLTDVAVGDRVLVNGSTGDTATSLTATRVVVMKSTAIAASRVAEEAAWARGAGGIVRSVDGTSGAITVSSGMRTLTVDTTPQTLVRRYAGGSVRFEDATKSNVAAILPGDQLRARGQRSPDGSTVIADEVVVGSFSNFSGILSAIDTALGTVTLKDLATKRTVTVAVTSETNFRRLPPGAAQAMATHSGTAGHGQAGATAPTTNPGASADASSGAGRAGGGAGTGAGPGAGPGAGADLSRMLNRLPTETLPGIKSGDAVMIVASNNAETGRPTAITLLVGVEQILAAAPAGNTTLSPWSLGEGAGAGDASGAGGGGR